MDRFLLSVKNQDGTLTIVNAIEWDGATPYRPNDDQFLLIQQGKETIGWTRDAKGGDWTPPADE